MPIYCDSHYYGLRPVSGYQRIQPTGQTAYNMWVNNDDHGGGWVLVAVVRTGDDRAHWDTASVNINTDTGIMNGSSVTVGVKAYDANTSKMSDAWINAYRSQSSYGGTTAYWMKPLSWSVGGSSASMFVSSDASFSATESANAENARTIVSDAYEGTLSDRAPNTGTRGLGDHHTDVNGPFFAWCRHPESQNRGFRQDDLGESDGYLWIK